MTTEVTNQLIQQIVSGTVRNFINGFLVERKSRGLSKWTLKYFSNELRYFSEYLDEVGVVNLDDLTSDAIRHYLLGSVFGGQVKSTQDQHNRLIYK